VALGSKPVSASKPPPPALPRWIATVPEFLIFLVCILGAALSPPLSPAGCENDELRGDAMTVVTGAGAQLGMLAGAWFYWSRPEHHPPSAPLQRSGVLVSGAATFLISLPLLLIAAKLSEIAVKALGLPTERQSLIAMFANADSPVLLIAMIVLAVVLAPVTEELVFRAGLFRYLRSWAPRWVALAVSSVLFASLHVNWRTWEGLTSFVPLVVLAIMFSLAYERTGNIGTPIVAHALFNLNTIVLIFSGVGT
jgi:membrane protease YdiL (CAAX protease family)